MKNKLLFFLALWLALAIPALAQTGNNALVFDGVDDYAEGPSVNPSTFTISTWFNSSDNSGYRSILYTLNESTGTGFEFFTTGSQLRVCIYDGMNWQFPTICTSITTNKWYHIAATFKDGMLTLYLNGVQISTQTGINYTPGTEVLRLGNSSISSANFSGKIDEVAIWERALNTSEISEVMRSGITDQVKNGLMVYYPFNQGVAGASNSGLTTLYDKSGNGRDAALKNFALSGSTSNWIGSYELLTLPTAVKMPSSVNSTASANVILSSSTASWKAISNQPWLTLSPNNGTGSSTFSLTANSANATGTSRMATVTVSSDGLTPQTIQVEQTDPSTLYLSCTPGGLNAAIPDADKQVISKLILTGTIDARDFKTMRDLMPALKNIDLSGVRIEAYSGTEGTYNYYNDYNEYKANSIPECAFYNVNNRTPKAITSFTFPPSITAIGDFAFRWCSSLKGNLNLPKAVTTIGKEVFNGCSGLSGNLILPKSITSIGSHAFVGCSGFTGTLEIPSLVKEISMFTFCGCRGLSGTISIPKSVTSIGKFAFEGCDGITEFIIPESVKTIGEGTFGRCYKVKSIIVNNGTPIDLSSSPNVFLDIDKKACTLHVPYGTVTLYSAADQWKDFTNIAAEPTGFTLSTNSVNLTSAAGSNTSVDLTANVSWTVSTDQPWLKVNTAAGTGNSVLKFTAETATSSIRTATVTVSAEGFAPKTITIKQIGATSVTLSCTAGSLSSSIPNVEKEVITKLTLTGTIDARDFKTMRDEMPALKEIDLSKASIAAYKGTGGTDNKPANYTENTIPQYAFFNSRYWTSSSITSFTFPSSTTAIGKYAFNNCKMLTGYLSIPNTVTVIDSSAFSGCNGLTGNLVIPQSVTAIRTYAFGGCSGFTGSLTLPKTITSIGAGAFKNCKGFTGSLTIPSSVTAISQSTFYGCSGFNGNLTIPESITTIEMDAFSGCSGLTGNLTLPKTITSIGAGAFKNCKGFTGSLTIPSLVKAISQSTFYGCSGLNGNLTIPESVKVIGGGAFYGCSGLTGNLTIPKLVTTIGEFAFSDCKGFSDNLTIPESVITIGESAFSGCSSIKVVHANNNTPINLSSSPNVFLNINKSTCTLSVPYGTQELYSAADQWKDFIPNIAANERGFRVASTSVNIGAAAQSTSSVDVKANVVWTVSSDQPWLDVSPNTPTATDGTIKFSTTTENTWIPRTATVTVSSPDMASKTITVTQTGTLYKDDPTALTLSENMDATAPVVDQPSITVTAESGKTLYFRFKPTVSGTYNIISQSTLYDPVAILYNNSGTELYFENDGYEYEGNPNNFSLSYNLIAGQVYYLGIQSRSNGSNPIPIKITGGDLECFTWKNKDNTGSWNSSTNWNWELLPTPYNSTNIDGTIALDQDVTATKFTALPSSNVSNAPSKVLYASDIITNKGTIINNGTIFTGNKLMNYGVINNNGKIIGPVFAPIVLEENGGAELENLMPQYGSNLILPEPIKTGSKFVGWYTDKALISKFETTSMPLNGFTLYAKWVAIPTVKTQVATNISTTAATVNSTIVDFGIPNPSQYGVVWSTSSNPTVDLPTKTEHGAPTSTGDFLDNLSGLLPNTTYYVKAYAINTTGTAYGEEVSFTTKAIPVITWNTPTTITYGKSLGDALPQATANTPGSFTYSPPLETILNAGTEQIVKVDFTPSEANYISASKTIKINVNKAKLSISQPTVVTAKLYDANTTANINTIGQLSGVIPSDLGRVSVSATANYNDAAVGSNKTIKVAYTISGNAIANYVAPDDFIMNGAAISEPITIKPLEAPQAGCEGEKSNLSYTILSGKPVEYQIIFEDKALGAGFKNIGYTAIPSINSSDAVQISIPSQIADGTYKASLQMRDEYGFVSELSPFQFTVNVSADVIVTKFGKVVLCDNSSNRFTAYQWYKNETPINGATSQFYKDPNGIGGSYYVQVKTTTGETLNTCSKVLNIQKVAQASLSVYPNPVKVGQECTVKISGFNDEELQNAVMTIYSTQGIPVYTSRKVEQTNRMTLSGTDGVYMGRITTANNETLSFKIIMAN